MDAAGNDPSCHEGARKLGDALTKGLNTLVAKYGNDPAEFKQELGKLLNDLHKQHSIDTKAQADGKQRHTPVTAAFALRINLNDGKQLAITGTIGDARVLHQKGTGEVHNKSTNIYYKSYEDSGGALGYEKMSKYNAPDALIPVQMDAFLLEKGDRIILGSDGMGDNLEARRLGVSPKAAAQALQKAGRLPEGVEIDALSDDIKEWTVKPRDNDKLQQIQKVHNAFIEYQAEVIIKTGQTKNQAPGAALFAHCTENPAVSRGAERVKIEYQMEDLRRAAHASLENKVANSDDFKNKQEELKRSTKEELKEVVVESLRSSLWGKVKDGFAQVVTPKRRQEALDREAEIMLTAGTEELSQKARDIRTGQDKKITAAKLEIRNTLVENAGADVNRINEELNQLYNELLAIGKTITEEHPELQGAWNEALSAQQKTQQDYQSSWKNDYAVSPVALICNGPVNTFIQTCSMKPDDVAISTLDSQNVEAEQKPKLSLKPQNLQRRQSIAEWEDEPESGKVKESGQQGAITPPMPKVEDDEYLI